MQKILLSILLLLQGKIQNLLLPAGGMGLRVDSAVYPGYTDPAIL